MQLKCHVSFCVKLVFISSKTRLLLLQTVTFSISYTRQEHCETQMLRKRVKDLETEYKQLQLECQVKESRVLDLESDVEVSFHTILGMSLNVCGPVLGCPQFGLVVVFFFAEFIFLSVNLCLCKNLLENWIVHRDLSVRYVVFGLQSTYCTLSSQPCAVILCGCFVVFE